MGPKAARLLEAICRLHLDDRDPHAASMRLMAEQGMMDEQTAQLMMMQLEPLIQRQRLSPVYLARPPRADELYADGKPDIICGSLVEALDLSFGLRCLNSPPDHTLLLGKTGSGKTTAMRRIIISGVAGAKQLGRKISWIVFDRKGGDFADLSAMLGPDWMHVSVHDGFHLGLNPPPGLAPNIWINILCRLIAARLGLVASATTLGNLFRFLLPHLPDGHWPDFGLLLEVLERAPQDLLSAKSEYTQTLIQACTAVEQAVPGLFCARSTFFDDLIAEGKSVVVDTRNLEPSFLRLLMVDIVVERTIAARLQKYYKTDCTDVIFMVDEAEADVSRKLDEVFVDGMAPLSKLFRQGRELGLMGIVGMAFPGQASRYILSSARNTLVFHLSHDEDCKEALASIGVRNSPDILSFLRQGGCLFRAPQSCWPQAMLGQIDYVPPRRGPLPASFDTPPFVPAQRLSELPELQRALEAKIKEYRTAKRRRFKASQPEISKPARKLLDLAALHPDTPVARLWEKVEKPSASVQQRARRELEKVGYARFSEPRLGRTQLLLIELLDAAWKFRDESPPRRRGRGEMVHRHMAAWIARASKQRGCQKVTIEWVVPGTNHPADVAVFDGQWHVFEVVDKSRNNLVDSIRTTFLDGQSIADVTVVTTQAQFHQDLRNRIAAAPDLEPFLDRIRFGTAETYLRELWP